MEEKCGNINRRRVLKSTSSLIGGGLMAGTAAAAKDKDKKADGNQIVRKFEELLDSITVANGKAKPSSKKKIEVSVKGESRTYTAQGIAKQINKGVEEGHWEVKKSDSKLSIDLTEKGRRLFFNDQPQPQSECEGESGIYESGILLNDHQVDTIEWGAAIAGGVLTVAAAIVGSLGTGNITSVVMAASLAITQVTESYIDMVNEGCGIVADSNGQYAQPCNC